MLIHHNVLSSLRVYSQNISTAREKIAQIYLQYLHVFPSLVEERTYISVCGRGGCAGGKDGKEQQSHRLHVQLHGDDAVHHLTRSVCSFFHHSPGIVWELRSCHQRSPEMSWSAICSDLHHQISRQDEIFVNAKPEGIKNQRRIRSCPNGWEKFTVRGSSVDWGKFLAEPQAATTLRPRRRLPSQAALRPTPTVSLLSLPGELAYSYFQSNLLFACLLGWKQIKDYLDTTSS